MHCDRRGKKSSRRPYSGFWPGAILGVVLLLLVGMALAPCSVRAGVIGGFELPAKKAKPKPLASSPGTASASVTRPGATFTEPVTGMEFIWVPGGCFRMGSPSGEEGRNDDEGPVHKVCVDGFWMGKYEVTNAEFRKFKSGHDSKAYEGCSLDGARQPVVYVSWEEAAAFADWLSKKSKCKFRLPTEAEWEYACRAGTTTARFWGEDPAQACAWANVADSTAKSEWSGWPIYDCKDGFKVAAPVGSLKPNAFGLYDMLGNVWEWCADWYGENYYAHSPIKNPRGPGSGSFRVFRGGSWRNDPWIVRSALRSGSGPGYRDYYLGFRLVAQGGEN